jgi:hypothetical protein
MGQKIFPTLKLSGVGNIFCPDAADLLRNRIRIASHEQTNHARDKKDYTYHKAGDATCRVSTERTS